MTDPVENSDPKAEMTSLRHEVAGLRGQLQREIEKSINQERVINGLREKVAQLETKVTLLRDIVREGMER